MPRFQRITPCLWFDDEAEEAANYYVSIFANSRVIQTTYYGKTGQEIHGKPEGSVLTVLFALDGQEFTALNGGPEFTFSEAISLQLLCESEAEVDYFWGRLAEGGEEGRCGWLKDRFGLSWQVVPAVLLEMLSDPDGAKVERVRNAVFQMKKLEIPRLERAFALEE